MLEMFHQIFIFKYKYITGRFKTNYYVGINSAMK